MKLNDQDVTFSYSNLTCLWDQYSFGWLCSDLLERGRVVKHFPYYASADYDGTLLFFAPGKTVHKFSDLVGQVWSGRGDIVRHVGSFSWTPHSTLQFQVLSYDARNKMLRFRFDGSIDYLTAKHPKGELCTVHGEVVTKVRTQTDYGKMFTVLSTEDPSPNPYLNLKSLQSLAEHNDLKAQFLLGQVYVSGIAVQQSWDEAFHWWRQAAEAGYAEAQASYSLKFMRHDPVRAYMWNYLAAKNGYVGGRDSCRQMAKDMSQDQIDEAIRMAKAWKPGTSEFAEQPIVSYDLQKLQKEVDSGDAEAEFMLAQAYRYGRGIPEDLGKWMNFLQAAAEDGSGRAQYEYAESFKAFALHLNPPLSYEPRYRYLKFAASNGIAGAYDELLEIAKTVPLWERIVWSGDYLGRRFVRQLRFSRAFFNKFVIWLKKITHAKGSEDAEFYCARLLSPNHGISMGATRDLIQLSLSEKRALVPYLTDALGDFDEDISQKAFKVLRWIAPQAPDLANEVIKALKPRRFWTPRLATWRVQQILCRMGQPAETALSAIANSQNMEMASLAKSTLQDLAVYRQNKIWQVIESKLYSPTTGFSDANPWIQAEPLALPMVLEQLHDPDRKKRLNAINALGDFGVMAHKEVPSVAECLHNKDPNRCRGTQAEFEEIDRWRSRSISGIAAFLRSDDQNLKRQAVFALQKFATPEASAALNTAK